MISGTAVRSRFSAWYERESTTVNYDVFTRLPALLYFSLGIWMQTQAVIDIAFGGHRLSPALYAATLVARTGALAVFVVFALLTLVRSRPVARSEGLLPRLTAVMGAGAFFGFAFLTRPEPELVWEIASTIVIAISAVLTSVVVMGLGRSFSTMPEARRLVTTGPYAVVRHPLYAAEAISTVGIMLQFRTLPALTLLVVQFALQVRRMIYEERVLASAFPEYASYARRTARVIPGIF